MSTHSSRFRWWDKPPPQTALCLTYRTPGELTGLRDAAARYARSAGMAAGLVPQMVLAVSELASNTMRHTFGPGTLHLWRADGSLFVQVSDTGVLPQSLVTSPPTFPPPSAPSGYGLALAAAFSDEMLIHAAPAVVRLRFRLS